MEILKLPPSGRREVQLVKILSRALDKTSKRLNCVCGPLPAYCFCDVLNLERKKLVAMPHSLRVFLHPRELSRSNSTHRFLLSLFGSRGGFDVLGSSGGDAGGGFTTSTTAEAWNRVGESCKVSGQRPCVLFPGAHSVPLQDWYARVPTEERTAGLHIVVLDSTWSESNSMARELASLGAPFVSLTETASPASLFSACRKQAAPSKVCTAEAVAAMIGELGGAGAYHSRVILYCCKALVDRVTRQTGLVGPLARGPGYRTWSLGESGAGAFLGRLPTWILELVGEYAYGPGVGVIPGGYFWRLSGEESVTCNFESKKGTSRSVKLTTIPPPSVYTRCPLARTSSALYFFSAGYWKQRRAQREGKGTHSAEKEEEEEFRGGAGDGEVPV